MGKTRWTKEDVELLRKLYREGNSAREMVGFFPDRTSAAVAAKLSTLGLSVKGRGFYNAGLNEWKRAPLPKVQVPSPDDSRDDYSRLMAAIDEAIASYLEGSLLVIERLKAENTTLKEELNGRTFTGKAQQLMDKFSAYR